MVNLAQVKHALSDLHKSCEVLVDYTDAIHRQPPFIMLLPDSFSDSVFGYEWGFKVEMHLPAPPTLQEWIDLTLHLGKRIRALPEYKAHSLCIAGAEPGGDVVDAKFRLCYGIGTDPGTILGNPSIPVANRVGEAHPFA